MNCSYCLFTTQDCHIKLLKTVSNSFIENNIWRKKKLKLHSEIKLQRPTPNYNKWNYYEGNTFLLITVTNGIVLTRVATTARLHCDTHELMFLQCNKWVEKNAFRLQTPTQNTTAHDLNTLTRYAQKVPYTYISISPTYITGYSMMLSYALQP